MPYISYEYVHFNFFNCMDTFIYINLLLIRFLGLLALSTTFEHEPTVLQSESSIGVAFASEQ